MIRKRILILALALISASLLSKTIHGQGDISAEEILKKVQEPFDSIQDYVVDIQARVDMEGVRVPEMVVKVSFKQPDKVHFESEGFAMLPREGIIINPAKFLEEGSQAALLGKDSLEGEEMYLLELVPTTESLLNPKVHLWVDGERWVIRQIKMIPAQGGGVTVRIEPVLVQGEFWLPQKTTVEVDFPQRRGMETRGPHQDPDRRRPFEKPPRSGKITITFSNYQINTGLSDEIFEEETQ